MVAQLEEMMGYLPPIEIDGNAKGGGRGRPFFSPSRTETLDPSDRVEIFPRMLGRPKLLILRGIITLP